MRLLPVVLLVLAPSIAAHGNDTPGSILLPVLEENAGEGVVTAVDLVPYGTRLVPNGILYYTVEVDVGSSWQFTWDDGLHPFVIGTASTCPGPRPSDNYDSGLPTEGTPADEYGDRAVFWLQDPGNNVWLYCRFVPDFDVWIACDGGLRSAGGPTGQDPIIGDCEGALYLVLVFGDLGESFTVHEGF